MRARGTSINDDGDCLNATIIHSSELVGQLVLIDARPIRQRVKHAIAGFLAGFDIQPGQYRVNADGRPAYAAPLALEPTGEWDIIYNDLNDGSVILTIQPGDLAFEFTGILEPLG